MMTVIQIFLGCAALYGAVMWAFTVYVSMRTPYDPLSPNLQWKLEGHSFHLGLCFILAAGFLGLMLK